MTEPLIVWVLECGMWSDKDVGGVYATVEAGIADNPVTALARPIWPDAAVGWHQEGTGPSWENGASHDDFRRLSPYTVQS